MNKKVIFSLFVAAMLLGLTGLPGQSEAADVSVRIAAPPAITISSDPDLVLVPKTRVYHVADAPGVYYYNGAWYRSHEKHWFRASTPTAEWVYVKKPPRVITTVPADLPPGPKIKYTKIKVKKVYR